MSQTRRFSPGVIDYDGRMSAGYQSGRALSPQAAGLWTTIVAPFVESDGAFRILDLGAGTGRFSALFARALPARVIGVEPSRGMLAVASRGEKLANLRYAAGTAECIPLQNGSCRLAWLSHVWHHIRDHQACARELQRVVSAGGHLLVRGTFGDLLDGYPTLFRFWPAARDICLQLPAVPQTVSVFESAGFTLIEHRRVEQATAASLREFAERTRARADTALTLISDSEFLDGQAAIELEAAREHVPVPVVEQIELLVFQKQISWGRNVTGR